MNLCERGLGRRVSGGCSCGPGELVLGPGTTWALDGWRVGTGRYPREPGTEPALAGTRYLPSPRRRSSVRLWGGQPGIGFFDRCVRFNVVIYF